MQEICNVLKQQSSNKAESNNHNNGYTSSFFDERNKIIAQLISLGKKKHEQNNQFIKKNFGFTLDINQVLKKDYFWLSTRFEFIREQQLLLGKIPVFYTFTLQKDFHQIIKLKNDGYKFNKIRDFKQRGTILQKNLQQINQAYSEVNKTKKRAKYLSAIEPHVDFTPHMHAIFFLEREEIDLFNEIVEETIDATKIKSYSEIIGSETIAEKLGDVVKQLKPKKIIKNKKTQEVKNIYFGDLIRIADEFLDWDEMQEIISEEAKKSEKYIKKFFYGSVYIDIKHFIIDNDEKDENMEHNKAELNTLRKEELASYLYYGWKIKNNIKNNFQSSRLTLPRVLIEKIRQFLLLDFKDGNFIEQIENIFTIKKIIYERDRSNIINASNPDIDYNDLPEGEIVPLKTKIIQEEDPTHKYKINYHVEAKKRQLVVIDEVENMFKIDQKKSKKPFYKMPKYTKSRILKMAWKMAKFYKVEFSKALKAVWKTIKLKPAERDKQRKIRVYSYRFGEARDHFRIFTHFLRISKEFMNLPSNLASELAKCHSREDLMNFAKKYTVPHTSYAIKYIDITLENKETVILLDKRENYKKRLEIKEKFTQEIEEVRQKIIQEKLKLNGNIETY